MEIHAGHSRRQFIKRTLVTTGTLGFTTASGQPQIRDRRQIDSDALSKFRAQLKGRLIIPTDAGYEGARRVYYWNPETERRPAAIVRCGQADDVRRAVEFARRNDLEVAVRGGGHSAMGWGSSNGLVIDLTGMESVTIDPAKRVGRVEAGVSGGEVMRHAGRYGLAPVLGMCPGVGAAGVTLGGGLSWLSGLHGAACDNLLSARLVTADGQILSVDAERDPELLWGLRGAGANFGVTTSFELRLHAVGAVTAGDIYYAAREARPVLRFFQHLMAEAPDSLQVELNLTPGERGVFVRLCHVGDDTEAERLLRSFRTVATPSKSTVRRQGFAELSRTSTAGAPNVNFRCLATVHRNQLSDEVMDAVLDRLSAAPPETVIGISHLHAWRGLPGITRRNGLPTSRIGSGSHSDRVGLERFSRSPAANGLGRRGSCMAAAVVRRTDLRELPELCRQGLTQSCLRRQPCEISRPQEQVRLHQPFSEKLEH